MKKKIAHVTFDMRIGGAERVIYNLIENTDKLKYDLSIICIDSEVGPFGRQLREKGYEIMSFNRKPGFDLSLIGDMYLYIKKNNIDVLHCHQYTPYIYGLFGALFTKTRLIFTEHGRFYPDKRKIKRFLLNPVLNLFTDYITAISLATKDALIEFENYPANKISVIYNGIDGLLFNNSQDFNLRKKYGIPETSIVLGVVARLDPIKNLKMCLRSLNIVQQTYPDTYLLIIGDGPEKSDLEGFVSRLELKPKVIFTGFREDTHLFYSIMDIFLLTSFSEGTAITLLEAMVASLPCIATDVGGNPEIVKDCETGYLVQSDDERELAEKICEFINNKNLIEQMGKAGRKRFEENFTVERMVTAYEELYDVNY